MSRRVMLVCCVVFAALLWSAVAADEPEIIDIVWTDLQWLALDNQGDVWLADPMPWICQTLFTTYYSYPGACGMDFSDDLNCGVIAFPNGDLQPIIADGQPDGGLIAGPPGASGIEEVRMSGNCDQYTIRSGCVFWSYDSGAWMGPCEPFGPGASEAETETWSDIKAEFRE